MIELPDKFDFLFEPHRYKVAWGGRGGAKSHSYAKALLILGAQRPERILCTREVQKSIKDSVHKLLADQIQILGLGYFYEVFDQTIRGANGTEIIFSGLANHTVESIKSFEGITICWCEEAQTISKRSWDILIPTIRDDRSEIWISFNPDLNSDETYVRFVLMPPASAKVVKVNYSDNPWFPSVLEEERIHWQKNKPEDYDNIWEGVAREAAEGSYFGDTILRHKNTVDGIYGFIRENDGVYTFEENTAGIVEIWDSPYNTKKDWEGLEWLDRYTVGSDVSEGLGATSSTGYVFDRHTDEFVAKMSSNKIDAYIWANMLYDLSKYYANSGVNSLLCVEKTGAGQTTVKRLKDRRARQYTVIRPDQTTNKPVKKYGWNETHNSKQEMSGELKRYLRETEGHVRCKTLLAECTTYVLHEDNHLGHLDGEKDDHVIGAGLALQACNVISQPARQTKVRQFMAAKREEEIKTLGTGASASAARMLDQTRAKYENDDEEEWT